MGSSKKKFRKYKASRDIPIACRELQSLSPTQIRDWIKRNRTKKDKRTGKRVQHQISLQAVTNWFRRHPDIHQTLNAEIVKEELPKDYISESLFENGVFDEIDSIKRWKRDLTLRGAKHATIKGFVRYIKRACQGQVAKEEILEGWGLKHPDELTIEDAKNFIYEMKVRHLHSRNCRLAFRNYFTSRGVTEREVNEISGALEGAGKYAHLYVIRANIYKIFDYLKALNLTAYLASKFAYKTAARIGATLTAEYSKINEVEHTILVLEKAKKGQPKRPVPKYIPEDLWKELDLDNLQNKRGRLFNITRKELNGLLRSAYNTIIPEIAKEIPKPFHFWRHQFAQHMLRALDWKYGHVAALGHWESVETLRKYYGMPPQEVIKEAGLQSLPLI